MGELPKGWEAVNLADVVLSRKGKKPEHLSKTPKDGYVPYILIDEMEGKPVRAYTNDKSVPFSTERDILIVWDGSIGKTASGKRGAIGSTIAALTPLHIETFYLESFLKLSKPYIEQTSRGSGLQHINPDYFWTLQVPVASLNEQRRIVAKLQKLMRKVDTCKERLDKIPSILKRFRQSVLSAACSGRLTADWREKNPDVKLAEKLEGINTKTMLDFIDFPELPSKWVYATIGEVANNIKYGTSQKCSYEKIGVPVLRIPNISSGIIDISDLKYADLSENEYNQLKLAEGDILLIRSNGSVSLVGKSAIIKNSEKDFAYAGYLIRIRFDKKHVSPSYINHILSSSYTRDQIEIPARSTSGVNNINSEEIKNLIIPLPPLPEQQEIVRRVESLFKKADAIEVRYKKAKIFVDKLTQSVLAKAFRGELVAQDPNDEPASVLLERIKAEKQKSQKKVVPIKDRVKKYKPFIPSDLPMAAEEKAPYGNKPKKKKGKQYPE